MNDLIRYLRLRGDADEVVRHYGELPGEPGNTPAEDDDEYWDEDWFEDDDDEFWDGDDE